MINEIKIAVLIDADNVSHKYIKHIMNEVANHGIPTYKRIYGNWTEQRMAGWKDILLENSITPIQQYSYTTGKNATDSALIIDAMDILYSENVDGFCIVSSDSDFTKLAARLRESGKLVVGMGEKKTPKPFISSCDRFKYLENLVIDLRNMEDMQKNTKVAEDIKAMRESIKISIKSIVADISNEEGWAYLADVGNTLNKRLPDFDTRNYGFAKLTPLIESLGIFEIRSQDTDNPHIKHKSIRLKNNK